MTDTDLLKNKHYIALNFKKAGISFSSENGDDPHDFLFACEDNITASNASDDAALKQIALCMTGSAYRWWQRNRNTINSWDQFKASFLENFLPVDYDLHLEDAIREKIQYDDDSFIDYVDAVEVLYSKMERQPPEAEKVKLLIRNVHPFFKSYFRGCPCTTMQELFEKAKEAEEEISEIHRYRILQQRQGQCTYEEYNIIPPLSRGTLYRSDENVTKATCMSTSDCPEEISSSIVEPTPPPVEVPSEVEAIMPVLPASEVHVVPTGIDESSSTLDTQPILDVTACEVKLNDETQTACEKSAQQLPRFLIITTLCMNFILRSLQAIRDLFHKNIVPFDDMKRTHHKHNHNVLKEKCMNPRQSQEPELNPHVPSQVLTWSLLPPDLQLFLTRKFQKMTTFAMKSRCNVDTFLNYSTVYVI